MEKNKWIGATILRKQTLEIEVREFRKEIKIATKCVFHPVETIEFEITRVDVFEK